MANNLGNLQCFSSKAGYWVNSSGLLDGDKEKCLGPKSTTLIDVYTHLVLDGKEVFDVKHFCFMSREVFDIMCSFYVFATFQPSVNEKLDINECLMSKTFLDVKLSV